MNKGREKYMLRYNASAILEANRIEVRTISKCLLQTVSQETEPEELVIEISKTTENTSPRKQRICKGKKEISREEM